MAIKTAKGKGAAAAASQQVPAETLNRIAQEIAACRRPMTLAELLEISSQWPVDSTQKDRKERRELPPIPTVY